MTYRLLCSCGHALYRGAETREEAIEKFRALETQEFLDQHFSQYHAGEQKPTLAQAHSMIEGSVARSVDAWGITLPPVTATA